MTDVEQQLEFPLNKRPNAADTSLPTILKRKTFMGAVRLCIRESGLERKEVYLPLDIDNGHYTKILEDDDNGRNHFPTNKLEALMDLCGNEIPLIWLAYKRGYELTPLLSTLEQQLEAKTSALQEAEKQNELLTELIQGKR